MSKNEIVKELIKKSLFLIVVIWILVSIGLELRGTGDSRDFFNAWVLCGLPFGIGKLRTWFYVPNGSIGTCTAIFVLNFILAGLIGGFVLMWKIIVAVCYIPVGIIRLHSYNVRGINDEKFTY